MVTRDWLESAGEDVLLTVRVQPRAGRSEIVGVLGGALKIRLSAPPVDGAANRELVAFLSKRLGVAKSSIRLEQGEKGRLKMVRVAGVAPRTVRDVLLPNG